MEPDDDDRPLIPYIVGMLLGSILEGFMMTLGGVILLVLLGVL